MWSETSIGRSSESGSRADPVSQSAHRIVHVCAQHSVEDRRVFQRSCCSLAKAGYEVHLVAHATPRVPIGTHTVDGVTVHAVRKPGGRRDRAAHRNEVMAVVRGLNADAYHVHEPELLGPTIQLAGGKPVIWDVHEVYMEAVKEREWIPKPLRPIAAFVWDRTEKGHLKRCAAVVPATESVARRYYPLHKKVVTIWNFPELEDFPVKPDAERDPGVFVYVGGLDEPRGVQQGVLAAGVLRKRGVHATFKIAPWHGEHRIPELQRLAEECGAGDSVQVVDKMSKWELAEFLNRAWIGLVPHLPTYRMSLNMPVKILEYMAMELPIVYTDLPNHVEMTDGRNVGIKVDTRSPEAIADAIQMLIEHPDEARAMGRRGRELIEEKFNWTTEARKLTALYGEILGRP